MILLFGVVSYKVRPPRLVSYACLYTTYVDIQVYNSSTIPASTLLKRSQSTAFLTGKEVLNESSIFFFASESIPAKNTKIVNIYRSRCSNS